MAILQRLPVNETLLGEFCRRWKIVKLELFGSMLTDPATFAQNELASLLERGVDLISRRAVEASGNALRRDAILNSALPVYVAG
jgi:uncharacterized protein